MVHIYNCLKISFDFRKFYENIFAFPINIAVCDFVFVLIFYNFLFPWQNGFMATLKDYRLSFFVKDFDHHFEQYSND